MSIGPQLYVSLRGHVPVSKVYGRLEVRSRYNEEDCIDLGSSNEVREVSGELGGVYPDAPNSPWSLKT